MTTSEFSLVDFAKIFYNSISSRHFYSYTLFQKIQELSDSRITSNGINKITYTVGNVSIKIQTSINNGIIFYFKNDKVVMSLLIIAGDVSSDPEPNKIYWILDPVNIHYDEMQGKLRRKNNESIKIYIPEDKIDFVQSNFYRFVFYLHDLEKLKAK